jgi:hypothetical protein
MVRSGYRNVPLENYAGVRLTPASLFVHVNMVDLEDLSGPQRTSVEYSGPQRTWTATNGGNGFERQTSVTS